MLKTVFATKIGMTQTWTKSGKRLAVTKCQVMDNAVVGATQDHLEIGYGRKKLQNMSKPLKSRLEKSGFSFGVKQIKGIKVGSTEGQDRPQVGSTLVLDQILAVGDVVKVQGTSKGRGFAGSVKRYGFAGGPATHGQSDRERAVGSIGAGTTPGRVFKGKRMPGHYGDETKTVKGLVVIYLDPKTQEVWLSGPVPGFNSGTIRIEKTGEKKEVEILKVVPTAPEGAEEVEVATEAVESPQVESTSGQSEAQS